MSLSKDLVKDGFYFDRQGRLHSDLADLALISLRIALRAYFSTYQAFKYNLHVFDSGNPCQKDIDASHSTAYCEACTEAIVHFQHFAELVCKRFLKNDHVLLSDIATNKPEILHKLIHGKPLTADEEKGIRSIEFSMALERIASLIKSGQLKDSVSLNFIQKHKAMLEDLNSLRNKVWHRGIFILRYIALDKFIGEHVLPFVNDVIAHPVYSGHEKLWKYKALSCEIDPISAIPNEFCSGQRYDIGKIALFKELGRAAYANPLTQLNQHLKQRAERIALSEKKCKFSDIKNCPVCGVESLVVSDDIDHECNEEGEIVRTWRYSQVKCESCSFDLQGGIKNASAYGITEIEDYWITE